MSQKDFIFSNGIRHRIARHAAFWLSSYIFLLVTFYIPNCVFPGWVTEEFSANSARLGVIQWLGLRIFNSTVSFIPLMAFAYTVVYFVLPRCLFDKKHPITTAALLIPALTAIIILQYYSAYLVAWNNLRVNPARTIAGIDVRIRLVINEVLYNYPIVAGFAVTVKMMKRAWIKQKETEQVAEEKVKTELQILRGQIHPHFLFNTLNNIYFFTLTYPHKAVEMLIKLTAILRYIISDCARHLVPVEKELEMIKDYVALEKMRYGERLSMTLEIKGDYRHKLISPLLLIPLVENSFKHGASKVLERPWVDLKVSVDGLSLLFFLSNSRPGTRVIAQHNRHIGLMNVKKRLQLLHPLTHEMIIEEGADHYEVFLKVDLVEAESVGKDEIKEASGHAVA